MKRTWIIGVTIKGVYLPCWDFKHFSSNSFDIYEEAVEYCSMLNEKRNNKQ